MPRPKPNFTEHIHYFESLTIVKPDNETYNNNTKILIKCPHGHEYKLSVNQIKNQKKNPKICPHCKNEKKSADNQIQFETVYNYFKNSNVEFEPKRKYYDRWNDVIHFVCNECGYENDIKALAHWEKTKSNTKFKCPGCEKKKEIYNGKSKSEINDIFDQIKHKTTKVNIEIPKETYLKHPTPAVFALLEKIKDLWYMYEYNGTRKKASFICLKCGNKKYILPLNMRGRNIGCRECFLHNQKINVEQKLIDICNESNIYFSDEENFKYDSTEKSISFTCNKCGHIFSKTWADITGCYYKMACPSCNVKNKSKKETEFYKFIKEIYTGTIKRNVRTIIKPYELDVFLPNEKLAFEFCGNLWHSSIYIKDNTYHAKKTKMCNEKSIRLVTIFEDEWDDKNDICKSRIKSFLNLSNNIIYARNCIIKNIDEKLTKEFLNKTHIQGSCNFDYSFGLLYNNKLVSVMTFKNTMNTTKKHDMEMNRFSVDLNTSVVGGFSKLLNHFKSNVDFTVMATFADLRWSNGNVYEKNGMIFDYEIRPRYSYVGNSTLWKRKHRFGYNKSKLIEKYGSEYSNKSEKEITESLKLYRLYDCGYLKFLLKNNVNI